MLNLLFLPLMRNTIPVSELVVKSINLAQSIPDTTKKNACIAAAFAFANRYLNEDETDKLLEVLRMTDLATMLVEDAVNNAINDEKVEIAKNMIKDDLAISAIIRYTGLDESKIERIQAEMNNN